MGVTASLPGKTLLEQELSYKAAQQPTCKATALLAPGNALVLGCWGPSPALVLTPGPHALGAPRAAGQAQPHGLHQPQTPTCSQAKAGGRWRGRKLHKEKKMQAPGIVPNLWKNWN